MFHPIRLLSFVTLCSLIIKTSNAKLGPTNINVHDIELELLSQAITEIASQSDAEDFTATYIRQYEGSVKVYRPKVFKTIRKLLDLQDSSFFTYFRPQHLICIGNTDSKSGQRFWMSADGKIILKTLKHYEAKNLQAVLDQYQNHVLNNQHCSIASVLGLYRVKLRNSMFSKYYLVSRNVFPLLQEGNGYDSYIHGKYDLKGSTQGRIATGPSSVLKDVDLMRSGRVFSLGEMGPLFMQTLARDVGFLRRNQLMDYSLLVSVESCPSKSLLRFPTVRRMSKFGSSLKDDRYESGIWLESFIYFGQA